MDELTTKPFKTSPNLFKRYGDTFGVRIIENWAGLITLEKCDTGKSKFLHTSLSYWDICARMETGLSTNVDYLSESLLKTGHKWVDRSTL